MEVTDGIISKLTFCDYKINEILFEANNDFEPKMVNLLLNVEKNIEYVESNTMNVNIIISVFEKSKEYPFYLRINLTGMFIINPSENNINYEKNAIAILFPYIRSIITNITSQANVQPLILPPININKLIEDNINNK